MFVCLNVASFNDGPFCLFVCAGADWTWFARRKKNSGNTQVSKPPHTDTLTTGPTICLLIRHNVGVKNTAVEKI